MKQIEVNYKSDFNAILALEGGWGVPFKAKFWTSTPSRAFIASWDGGENYCHCHLDPDGRMCFGFDNHNMGTGKLMLELTFYIDNTCFDDGICSEVIAPFSPTFVDKSGEEYIVTLGFKGMDTLTVVGTLPAFFNKGDKGDKGDPGESAYEVAVRNGFEGTEEEWLASLHGKDGKLTPEQEQMLAHSVQVIDLDNFVTDGKFVSSNEFVVRLNGVVTQEYRIFEAARFDLFETAGNIRAYIILIKDESVENGWTWVGCISTEGDGKLYDRNIEEVQKIGGSSYAEWKVYLDIVFPPAVVDAYTKDESDEKFQPKGSYATSDDLKNLESELGKVVKVINLNDYSDGQIIPAVPFVTVASVSGSEETTPCSHYRDGGSVRVDCFTHDISEMIGLKHAGVFYSIMSRVETGWTLLGYLLRNPFDLKPVLYDAKWNNVESFDDTTPQEMFDIIMPMFNEDLREGIETLAEDVNTTKQALETTNKKVTQIGLEVGELKEGVEELKDKSADAQDVVDLEEKVNAVARGDFGTPDYGTNLPLMCGQPMVLFGAGTPQEAIVPDNWKQYDADTDEGYDWNGLPSALGQRYINVSASSRAEYIAVRTSYDKNNANYDVLKWLNL